MRQISHSRFDDSAIRRLDGLATRWFDREAMIGRSAGRSRQKILGAQAEVLQEGANRYGLARAHTHRRAGRSADLELQPTRCPAHSAQRVHRPPLCSNARHSLFAAPTLREDGALFIADLGGCIYKLSNTARLVREYDGDGATIASAPAIAANGHVLYGTTKGKPRRIGQQRRP